MNNVSKHSRAPVKTCAVMAAAVCCLWAGWSDAENPSVAAKPHVPAPVIAPVSVAMNSDSQAAPAPALAERSALLNMAPREAVLAPAVSPQAAASKPAETAKPETAAAPEKTELTPVPKAEASAPKPEAPAAKAETPAPRPAPKAEAHEPKVMTVAKAEVVAEKHAGKEKDEPKDKEAAKEPKDKGTGNPLGKSDAPVRIDADRLEVDRKGGMAVFSGNVTARQGDMTLTGARMNVYYAEKGAAGSDKTPGVKRIEITGGVRVTNGKEDARGDRGVYDAEKKTVTLEGEDLQLQSGGNSIRGKRLIYDVTTGKSRMEGGASGGGRVTGIFRPGEK